MATNVCYDAFPAVNSLRLRSTTCSRAALAAATSLTALTQLELLSVLPDNQLEEKMGGLALAVGVVLPKLLQLSLVGPSTNTRPVFQSLSTLGPNLHHMRVSKFTGINADDIRCSLEAATSVKYGVVYCAQTCDCM